MSSKPRLLKYHLLLALCVLLAVGVFVAPINSHLQNGAYLILAIVAFVVFVLAHRKLGTFNSDATSE